LMLLRRSFEFITATSKKRASHRTDLDSQKYLWEKCKTQNNKSELILHALQSKAETTDLVQSKLKQTTHVKTRMLLYLFRPKKTTHVKLLTIIYFSHSGFKVLLQCTWHFCLYYLWPSNLISTALYIYRTLRRQLQQIILSKCEPCFCQDTINL
jgi:hypothetical protein